MTAEEYKRICGRLARKAIRYAKEMGDDEKVNNADVTCPKCKRLSEEPCKFPVWSSGEKHDASAGFVHNERSCAALDAQREHWINVFLDEYLPDIDPDVLLKVTDRADAWAKSGGHRYAGKEVRANAAFQADVWDAINRQETP